MAQCYCTALCVFTPYSSTHEGVNHEELVKEAASSFGSLPEGEAATTTQADFVGGTSHHQHTPLPVSSLRSGDSSVSILPPPPRLQVGRSVYPLAPQ